MVREQQKATLYLDCNNTTDMPLYDNTVASPPLSVDGIGHQLLTRLQHVLAYLLPQGCLIQ